MNLIDINTAERPVVADEFDLTADYPFCLLGFLIKNNYDQLRHNIPKNYTSVNIMHPIVSTDTSVRFFRGIKIEPSSKAKNFIQNLSSFKVKHTLSGVTDAYIKLISEYNYTCETCVNNLQPGVYPIDGSCVKDFTEDNIDLTKLYESIFASEDVPFFQSIGYISIYILDQV